MLIRLLILFTIVPIIEIYLIIKTGQVIGPLPTVVLLLAMSFAGAWLVRTQGFQTLRSIQYELAQGRLPAAQLLDEAMVLVGGGYCFSPPAFSQICSASFSSYPSSGRLSNGWSVPGCSAGSITGPM